MTVEQLSREATELSEHSQTLFGYLWDGATQLLDAGIPRERIVTTLEDLYDLFGRQGRGDAQDEVIEVLNSLTGYCSPSARLSA